MNTQKHWGTPDDSDSFNALKIRRMSHEGAMRLLGALRRQAQRDTRLAMIGELEAIIDGKALTLQAIKLWAEDQKKRK